MTNEHLPGCDCYDCLDKTVIGKSIKSNKEVFVYDKPGGKLLYTVKPGKYIGTVKSITSNGRWIQRNVYPYGYIFVTPDLTFETIAPISDNQKAALILDAVKNSAVASGSIGSLAVGSSEVVEDTTKNIIKFLPKLKWIIIGVVVLLVLILIVKIKS